MTKVDKTICGQYIGFCKVYTHCLAKYKHDKSKVLVETIKLCLEKGYLVEFLNNNLEEVSNTMGFFRDQEKELNDYISEKVKKGIAKGKAEGIAEGIAKERQKNLKLLETLAKKYGIPKNEFMNIYTNDTVDVLENLSTNNSKTVSNNHKKDFFMN